MVRIMVGTLVTLGKGKLKPDDIKTIIEAKNREAAAMTAPPQGLFLVKVEYAEEIAIRVERVINKMKDDKQHKIKAW